MHHVNNPSGFLDVFFFILYLHALLPQIQWWLDKYINVCQKCVFEALNEGKWTWCPITLHNSGKWGATDCTLIKCLIGEGSSFIKVRMSTCQFSCFAHYGDALDPGSHCWLFAHCHCSLSKFYASLTMN